MRALAGLMGGGGDPRGTFDVLAARALAFHAMDWTAGAPLSEANLHTATLAGGTIDALAQYVTDLTVGPGMANAHTRMPVLVGAGRRIEAARLGAAMNGVVPGGTFWIDATGTPGATVCMALSAPESSAAAGIVHAVHRSRALARLAHPHLARVAAGQTAAQVLEDDPDGTAFLDALSIAVTGTPFALAGSPAPTAAQVAEAAFALADSGGRRAEVEALARHQALIYAQAAAGLPLCSGPVVFHADGVVECFGCTDPLSRIHGGGLTGSCGPYRQLGAGHSCERCAPTAEVPGLSV